MSHFEGFKAHFELKSHGLEGESNNYSSWNSSNAQPLHTVYVPAHRVTQNLLDDWSIKALNVLRTFDPFIEQLTSRRVAQPEPWAELRELVTNRLKTKPIDDLRIDFEDGYRISTDGVEDSDVRQAASTIAQLLNQSVYKPPLIGIRPKSIASEQPDRGVRTLLLWVEELLECGVSPDILIFTIPKITSPTHIEIWRDLTLYIEETFELPPRTVRFELQIETPHSVNTSEGNNAICELLKLSDNRCTALHYGTYDYSASLGIFPQFQSSDHLVALYAKEAMRLAATLYGVWLSDGSSNLIPETGDSNSDQHAIMRHYELVTFALESGIIQGWDLHPGQLPTRYLANYVFYRSQFNDAATRLSSYLLQQSSNGVMDEPATARAIAKLITRGWEIGAISENEISTSISLTPKDLYMQFGLSTPVEKK